MCGYLLFLPKILHDTKELQKEINSLAGKLDRTFAVTDELVFKVMAGDQKRVEHWRGTLKKLTSFPCLFPQDAKRDEAVRKAYKYLAALHEVRGFLSQ